MARLGCAASSTSLAFVDAVHALDLRRVTIAATYPRDVVDSFVEFLKADGIDVVSSSSADIITAEEVGTLGRDRILRLVSAIDHGAADAVLLPDTALHSAAWLDDLESAAGKPVLTANQVTVWEGLRLAGHDTTHHSLGSLFRARPPQRTGNPST